MAHVHVLRRSHRRRVRDNRAKEWAEKSIWSMVCATDLGLVKPIKLTTSNASRAITTGRKCDLAKGNSGIPPNSRKSIFAPQSSRFFSLKKNNFPTNRLSQSKKSKKDLSQKSVLQEHPYALPESKFVDKFKLREKILENEESSLKVKEKRIHYFNVDGKNFEKPKNSTKPEIDQYNHQYENGIEFLDFEDSPQEQVEFPWEDFPENCVISQETEINERDDKRELEKPYNPEIIHKQESFLSNVNKENEANIVTPEVEKSSEKSCPMKIEETLNKRGEKNRFVIEKRSSNPQRLKDAISMSKETKKVNKTIPKNDYEDSDIDESLLVDPSTDLPQSLLETIDDNIDLANSQFEVDFELDFDTEDKNMSEEFERNLATIFKKSTKSEKKRKRTFGNVRFQTKSIKSIANKMAELRLRRQNGGNNAMRDKKYGKKREIRVPRERRQNGVAGVNKMASTVRQNGGDKENVIHNLKTNEKRENRAPGKRRSADDAVIANKMASAARQNGGDKENATYNLKANEKRENRAPGKRRSADDAVIVNKMASTARQNGGNKENATHNLKVNEKRENRVPGKRRSADDAAIVNKMVSAGRQNGGDKENATHNLKANEKRENRVPGKRRSADDAVIANKMAILHESRQNGVVPKRTTYNKPGGKMRESCELQRSFSNGNFTKMALSLKTPENGDEYTNEEMPTRVTRLSLKNISIRPENTGYKIGTVVWGNCSGWWPGIIVDADDIGMTRTAEKSWVCWIGEYRISHLRDKTQIQKLSTQFQDRMIDTLKSRSSRDPSTYAACMETLKLLNDQILDAGPLTKPYHVWAEKHLMHHPKINDLILYPYPPNVQPRLDQLRRRNVRATEKYLSEMSSEKPSSTKSTIVAKAQTSKDDSDPLPGHLPLNEQKPGVIAWAKIMGQPWWPAVIMDYRDCGMNEPSFGCQWILWYGDDTMSQVNHRFFLSFANGMSLMKEHAKNSKRLMYRRGVVDAAKDYCSRFGYKCDDWTIQDILQWFERHEAGDDSPSSCNVLPGVTGNVDDKNMKYPARIVDVLRRQRGNCTIAAAREHNIEASDILRRVDNGKTSIEDVCLMCLKDCEEDFDDDIEHPFFVGKLCDICSEKYKPTIFAYGDDGKCFFCTICAGSDTVVMCDVEVCPRVYCTACLKYLVAPLFYDDIMFNDPWLCFLCQQSGKSLSDGILKPRDDWEDRVNRLFRSNGVDSVPLHMERYRHQKRNIRVLSLFDGISAGLVVLKKLGIQIEAYYASEIDPDAEMISSANFGNDIVRLGDVRDITEQKLREIGPIDLLIGGSPCNDLSLVNPLRLGLHDKKGTGVLVFEYSRIKNILQRLSGDRHLFWMFENVAAMPSKYRLAINEALGREPDLIDSAYYSPQHRPRLYWSNLPTVSFPLSSQDLQDVLTPNCNRHALVKKIRTVTTKVNSLKQGRDSLKPILMNERNDTLWITELEEIFGFPRHYTDVKNLCATKRQKLIAMSWSVQTITEIMRPLCNFFQLRSS